MAEEKSIETRRLDAWNGITLLFSLVVVLFFPPVGVLLAFAVVLVLFVTNREKRHFLASLGFRRPESWKRIVLQCLALGVLIETSFQLLVNPVLERVTASSIDLEAFDPIRGDPAYFLAMLVLGWVVGGFIEEITFRGFLITRLVRLLGDSPTAATIAVLVTSSVFGLSHFYQGWSGMLSTAGIAAILGVIFIRTSYGIWYTILTHGFINLTGLTILFMSWDRSIRSLW